MTQYVWILVLLVLAAVAIWWRGRVPKPNEPFIAPPSLPHENVTEGYTTAEQRKHMLELIRTYAPNAKRILEIGFNAGHSAENFLNMNKHIQLVSFDLGEHEYVKEAKAYIDTTYPGQHTLILGDSTQTIPQYTSAPFDVIFIDGGHTYEVARADLANCRRLAHPQTLLFMDDTIREHPEWVLDYTKGPSQAWEESLQNRQVQELGFIDYSSGRGMSWGRYVLSK